MSNMSPSGESQRDIESQRLISDCVHPLRRTTLERFQVIRYLGRPTLQMQTADALSDLGMIMLNRLSLHLWLVSSVPLSLFTFFAVLLQLRDSPILGNLADKYRVGVWLTGVVAHRSGGSRRSLLA